MSDEKEVFKAEWFKQQGNLSEIYQQTGMLFAFISSPKDGSKVCHPWVKCRDFLHDAVRSQIVGKSCYIYGFRFDPKVNPKIDLKRMRMLVTKSSNNAAEMVAFKAKMASALVLINHFERQAKTSLSIVQEIDHTGSGKQAIFMFTGPSMWIKSPFLVSMYTLLIRLGDKELKFKSAKDLQTKLESLHKQFSSDNDAKYLTEIWDKLHPIIKNRKELFKTKDGFHDVFFEDTNIDYFHNYSGIVSLAKFNSRNKELNDSLKKLTKKEAK